MEGDSGRITVGERIDPEITATLFANYRSSADALMELIDNALDSRLPGQPMKVEVAFHGDSITVMSEGGEGMGPKDLERRCLRWGKSTKRGKELLGQYGQGGKAAIGHLGPASRSSPVVRATRSAGASRTLTTETGAD